MKHPKAHNRIRDALAVFLAAVLSLYSVQGAFVSAVAMEQQARCGVEEHTHTQACYVNGLLSCSQPAHSHSSNCYLVLLEENDINGLLSHVDEEQDNSLETVIESTVTTALAQTTSTIPEQTQSSATPEEPQNQSAQENGDSRGADITDVSGLDIAQLNQTLSEGEGAPAVVLNEQLYTAAQLTSSDDADPVLLTQPGVSTLAPTATGGVSTYAVGDTPQTQSGSANFYVYIDNQWTCIGTLAQEASRGNNWRYSARVSTADIVALINDSMGTGYTRNSFRLRYATSASASSWTAASIGSSYTTFGTNYYQSSSALQAKYVRMVDSSGDPITFNTVTYNYADGTQSVFYVRTDSTITLPEGNGWTDGAQEYTGGQTVSVAGPLTFTELAADGKVRIVYTVNFPSVSGVTVTTRPTLYGTTDTTRTDTAEELADTVLRNVSQQAVQGKVDGNTTNLSRMIYFVGWQVGDTDTILSPNSTLTWAELSAYAVNGRLALNGVWHARAVQTASFFVRYDSVAVDTEGNITGQDATKYTPELFASFVGGTDANTLEYDELNDKYYIADTSSDNSYGADQAIRALYGPQSGVWLHGFPDDDYIFEQLKDYAQYLQVDGEPVDVDDLNANAYTIRWYVFKCQSDAWHIDGRLVKKEGILHITKSFAGSVDGVTLAKQDFSITAVCEESGKRETLDLTNYDSYDLATDTYHWKIDGVIYNEPWTVTEHTYSQVTDGITTYFGSHSYRVVDIFNRQNQIGTGTVVNLLGETYATDAGEVEVLRVEFTNVYHSSDSIIIKKEDQRTGAPLGGATFCLMQNGTPLTFTYDSAKQRYIYDPAGALTQLSGSTTGYYELVVTGFSYADGDVVVQELEPPTGYTPVENVVIGYLDQDGEVGILSDSPLARYDNGLLVIANSTQSTSVTVDKQWLCPELEWRDVTVQLLANGQLVTTLIPGVEPAAVLTSSNDYRYTWTELPIYANGQPIVWSVRETKVGTESSRADGSFVNWLVSYGDPVYTYGADGSITNTAVTVQNDTRRTLLRLTKTNLSGTLRLPGATFTLEHLVEDGAGGYVADTDFLVRTATTGVDGTLTFDNLLYGYYRLTETVTPNGYLELNDPIYLTIQEDGTVVVDSHSFAQTGATAYSITVRNASPAVPLPATGAGGTAGYTILGAALMLLALGVYIIPKLRRREGYG